MSCYVELKKMEVCIKEIFVYLRLFVSLVDERNGVDKDRVVNGEYYY